RQTVSCDMLDHMVMTDMKLLVVETETAETLADDVDMVFCSTDVGRSKQVGQKMIFIALISQSAWIASAADNFEYFLGLVTPSTSTVGQIRGPCSTDSRIIL
nr:hypothetical protein [Tanacetum cinerariifolium]